MWTSEKKLERIREWKQKGLTNEDIAERLKISPRTLYNWATESSELVEALATPKEVQEQMAADALLKRAVGYKRIVQVPVKLRTTSKNKAKYDKSTGESVPADKQVEETVQIVNIIEEVLPDTNALIFLLQNIDNVRWRKKDRELQQTLNEVKILLERRETFVPTLNTIAAAEESEETV